MHTNIWLPDPTLPGFRPFMLDFFWRLNSLTNAILRALGESLQLSEADTEAMLRIHTGHNNQLRLLHYPPVPAGLLESKVKARMPAHTDWCSFTLLFQDDCGGLELEDPRQKGRFLAATPVEGALVLNIGDMWQRVSNGTWFRRSSPPASYDGKGSADALKGRFNSATHRVALPPLEERYEGAERMTRARYAIPYFCAPDHDALIKVYESLVERDGEKKYEDVVFKDYGAWIAKYQYKDEGVNGNAEEK